MGKVIEVDYFPWQTVPLPAGRKTQIGIFIADGSEISWDVPQNDGSVGITPPNSYKLTFLLGCASRY